MTGIDSRPEQQRRRPEIRKMRSHYVDYSTTHKRRRGLTTVSATVPCGTYGEKVRPGAYVSPFFNFIQLLAKNVPDKLNGAAAQQQYAGVVLPLDRLHDDLPAAVRISRLVMQVLDILFSGFAGDLRIVADLYLCLFERVVKEPGAECPGLHRHDFDAQRGDLLIQRVAEQLQRGFGGGAVSGAYPRLNRRNGGEVDDRSAAALPHLGQHRLDQFNRAEQIGAV